MNIDCVMYLCNCIYVYIYVININIIVCKYIVLNICLIDLIYNLLKK